MNRRKFLGTGLKAAAVVPSLAGLLASCGGGAKQGSESPKIRLVLNWKPDPQFGGFYAADYKKHGLDVDVLPGGAGTPSVQMVGAGSAEFGIVSADEIVLARAQGNDVVGLFAVFQNCPQGIMVHASRKLKNIGEVFNEGTVAIQRGLPYARLLERKYGFAKVKIVPSPGGDITVFLTDSNFAQQCFVMSEPLAAERQGTKVQVFPVADAGYNPYTTVLAVSGDLLRKKPEMAKAMVAAVREGWRTYLDNPKPTNDRMGQLNPSMNAETFAEVATAQAPYIETAQSKSQGLGAMTTERWQELIQQLVRLGDVKTPPKPEECFQTLA
jgi:NitT/TauT family transport system substrate-binding protein